MEMYLFAYVVGSAMDKVFKNSGWIYIYTINF